MNLSPAIALGALRDRLRRCASILWRAEARFRGVELRGKVLFTGRPLITVAQGASIVLENGVQIRSALGDNPLGCFQPSILRALAPGARLLLARDVGISGSVLCAGLAIEIGEGTILGAGAMILDNDFHQPAGQWGWQTDPTIAARPVKIGRGVFIGARAIILKGVTIGDRATIGAGALVARDVPPGRTAVGNPARVLEPKS